jgi:hypothetical protein
MKKVVVKGTINRNIAWTIGESHLWTWWDEIEAAEGIPYELIWYANQQQTIIHYIEDSETAIPFFVITGAEIEKTVSQITKRVSCYFIPELQQLVLTANTPDEYSFALYRLAIAANQEFDQDIFSIFKQVFRHTDAFVRQIAIGAASYITWEKMQTAIRSLSENDSDNDVRIIAKTLLEAYADDTAKRQ